MSHAVDGLVRKWLIEVSDEQGRLMTTSDERRRCCPRLFYSLAEPAETAAPRRFRPSFSETRTCIPRERHRELQNRVRGRGRLRLLPPPSRFRIPRHLQGLAACQAIFDEALCFLKALQEKSGQGEDAVPTLEPDAVAKLNAALERFGFERLTRLIDVFLACDITYVRRHGHTLTTFLAVLSVLPVLRSKLPRRASLQ